MDILHLCLQILAFMFFFYQCENVTKCITILCDLLKFTFSRVVSECKLVPQSNPTSYTLTIWLYLFHSPFCTALYGMNTKQYGT